MVKLGIKFPTEPDALRKQLATEAEMDATQRFRAFLDLLSVSESLSRASGIRSEQLEWNERLEDEWRERMKEFIRTHDSH